MPLAAVPAEVNDVWPVHQQEPLQIDRLYRCVLVQFESIAIRAFVNSFEDFPRLFVDQNATRRPGI